MFISPCTVRSTQCAALIALAAAAGIARVEAAAELPTRSHATTPTSVSRISTATRLIIFELASHAPAPWVRHAAEFAAFLFERAHSAGQLDAKADGTDSANQEIAAAENERLKVFVPTASTRSFVEEPIRPLCTVPYLLPFAVGPPGLRDNENSYAACTRVHGDSAADEVEEAGVVRFCFSIETGWSELLAVSVFPPSSALRGEPGVLFPSNRRNAAACSPTAARRGRSIKSRPNLSLS